MAQRRKMDNYNIDQKFSMSAQLFTNGKVILNDYKSKEKY